MSAQSPQHGDAAQAAALSSVVLGVYDLDASVRFYRDLLGLEATVTDYSAALLVGADGFQVYLHALGERAAHALDSVGIHAVIWTVPDADELQRCERWLQARDAHVQTWQAEEYTMVEGRDPSKLPVLLVHPGPNQAARHEILARFYGINT